jgi:hypothetical protein
LGNTQTSAQELKEKLASMEYLLQQEKKERNKLQAKLKQQKEMDTVKKDTTQVSPLEFLQREVKQLQDKLSETKTKFKQARIESKEVEKVLEEQLTKVIVGQHVLLFGFNPVSPR